MSERHEMTEEQKDIVETLSHSNVIVNAVAGSGKTTTILFLAKAYPEKEIMLITYNAKLRLETRRRCAEMELTNIEVHTYHSFCRKFYHNQCKTDSEIRETLTKNKDALYDFLFDILVLDEVQDMTPLYYRFVKKIVNDIPDEKKSGEDVFFCLLGDVGQSIFEFNGSDSRFLSMGDKVFEGINKYGWKKCSLSESFRITDTMAKFICNGCFKGEERIISTKKSDIKPRYIMVDPFQPNYQYNRIVSEINSLLAEGYLPSDIFILAPTIRNNSQRIDEIDETSPNENTGGNKNANKGLSPIIILENLLILNLKIPIYIPLSDEGSVDESVMNGKLVFLSFHQSKGLERKVVIVYNFDNTYFKYYEKVKSPNICPNTLYVAITRASERLILVHGFRNGYLPFMNIDCFRSPELEELANVMYYGSGIHKTKEKSNTISNSSVRNYGATGILRHLSQETIDTCHSLLNIQCIRPASTDTLRIPHTIKTLDSSEVVCDLNGICFPLYFELSLTNKSSILNALKTKRHKDGYSQLYQKIQDIFFDVKTGIVLSLEMIQELLYISNCWCAYQNKTIHKLFQIQNYNWLTLRHFEYSMERLNSLGISKRALFERDVGCTSNMIIPHTINGQIDIVDKHMKKIYEIKCTQELTKEHFIQLALYMYMYEMEFQIKEVKRVQNKKTKNGVIKTSSGMKYLLYNINTDHLCEIIYDDGIASMYLQLIEAKHKQTVECDDLSFLKQCLSI
jgi:ATP:corrinoid adenosyltransferase